MSMRFFGVQSFLNYAIADGIYNMLFSDKSALRHSHPRARGVSADSRLRIKTRETPCILWLDMDNSLIIVKQTQ